jgi:hypothetical protein
MPIIVGGILATPCFAPTILSPVNASYADLAGIPNAGCLVEWQYNPSIFGVTQTSYAIRAKITGAGSYLFWNASLSAWQSTFVLNSSTEESELIWPGAFEDGVIYNISVCTSDVNGTGPFAQDITVTALCAPTATITSPTGTVADAMVTVTWTPGLPSPQLPIPSWAPSTTYQFGDQVQPSPPNGFVYLRRGSTEAPETSGSVQPTWPTTVGDAVFDPTGQTSMGWVCYAPFTPTANDTVTPQQIAYRAIVYTAAQVAAGGFEPGVSAAVWDSGTISGAYTNSVPCPVALSEGSYCAYVQITETGGVTSSWASSAFTTSFAAPADPTFTATPGTGPGGMPIVTCTVVGNDPVGNVSNDINAVPGLGRLPFAPGMPLVQSLVGHTFASIQYSDDGGSTWWPLRNGTNLPLPADTQTVSVVDLEAPHGYTRLYRCQLTAEV